MARTKKKAVSKKKTRAKSRGRKSNTLSIDFEGVESGGGRPIPDGIYTAAIKKVEEKEGQDSGEPYLSIPWTITGGGKKKTHGAVAWDTLSLQPQALWRLRTLLESLGLEVPEGVMEIDPEDLVGLECEIEITNEDYQGKDRPRVTGYSIAGSDSEEEEEDEEDEEEDDEEETEEDEEEDEEDEEEEKPAKRSRRKKSGKLAEGSKVKFQDEDGDWVKGVIVSLEDDEATVQDSAGDDWDVELAELKAI